MNFLDALSGIPSALDVGWYALTHGFDKEASHQYYVDKYVNTTPIYTPPVDTPSTGENVVDLDDTEIPSNSDLDISSNYAYSNPSNSQYSNIDYYDQYLQMLQKGANIGLFATAQNVVDEAQKDRAFQALEAEKNRAWYENMSDTAYQRQIKDLEAAGLNPILGWAHSGVGSPTAMAPTATGRSTNVQAQAPSLSDYINAGSNLVNSASKLISSVTKLI